MNEEEKRSFGDWRPSDRIDSVGWAAVFIWAGLILLAENIGYSTQFSWWDGWAVFFTGAGIIVLVEMVIRQLKPEYSSPSFWDLIFGFILLGVGLGGYTIWFWPVVLLFIGLVILLSVLRGSD
jgi:hypothetical protein